MDSKVGLLSKNKGSRLHSFKKTISRDKYLLLMLLPIITYYIIFRYIPMTGLIVAFKDFKPGGGIYQGEWIGLKMFEQFFSSVYSWRIIRNTVLLSFYFLVFGFPIPILFAICVSEIRNNKFRRIAQTSSYLPHFISTVVLVGIITNFFSMNNGIVNNIIEKLGVDPINFLNNPSWFRPLYVGSSIWQNSGFNSIIFIAAIVGIDESLIESAKIDGITKFKQIYYITIPMILPTIIILLIMRLGRIMSVGFEKVFLMYTPNTYETADIISTYVYRKGIQHSNYSFATAVGFFNSVINFIFVFVANRLCRIRTNISLW